jgi:hypothetical protein
MTLTVFDSRPIARGGVFHGAFTPDREPTASLRESEEVRLLVVFNEVMSKGETQVVLLSHLWHGMCRPAAREPI